MNQPDLFAALPPDPVPWEKVYLEFLDALDAGHVAALAALWEQAAHDAELEGLLIELTDALAQEEGLPASWEDDTTRVQTLLRQHLPSAFGERNRPGPLTVGDVAARLQADQSLSAHFKEEDRRANNSLLSNVTPLPDDLGLPRFERWRALLEVSATAHYWRAFRQAAVLLGMGQCQRSDQLAAARPASPPSRGGQP